MDRKPTTAYPDANFLQLLDKAPLLMMFTPGKVASKSIGRSLEGVYPGAIVHAHRVNYSGVECPPGTIGRNHPDPRFSAAFRHAVEFERPTSIICPVRETLDRTISHLFYNYGSITGNLQPVGLRSCPEIQSDLYKHAGSMLGFTRWFDNELKILTGIDVYQHALAGPSMVLRNRNFEVLLIRCEENDARKEQDIRSFLGLDTFKIKPYNCACHQSYYERYQEFKRWFKPSKKFLDTIYSNRYHRHFYADIETSDHYVI